jgi:hypothetical protein
VQHRRHVTVALPGSRFANVGRADETEVRILVFQLPLAGQ